jgi:hypothetical protein
VHGWDQVSAAWDEPWPLDAWPLGVTPEQIDGCHGVLSPSKRLADRPTAYLLRQRRWQIRPIATAGLSAAARQVRKPPGARRPTAVSLSAGPQPIRAALRRALPRRRYPGLLLAAAIRNAGRASTPASKWRGANSAGRRDRRSPPAPFDQFVARAEPTAGCVGLRRVDRQGLPRCSVTRPGHHSCRVRSSAAGLSCPCVRLEGMATFVLIHGGSAWDWHQPGVERAVAPWMPGRTCRRRYRSTADPGGAAPVGWFVPDTATPSPPLAYRPISCLLC